MLFQIITVCKCKKKQNKQSKLKTEGCNLQATQHLLYRLHLKSAIVVLIILGQTETVRIPKRPHPINSRLYASSHKAITFLQININIKPFPEAQHRP